MNGTPPIVVVAVVLALMIFAGAVGLLRYADQLEKRESARQAALANARRDAQRRDFDEHVGGAFVVAGGTDWHGLEQEMQS